MFMWYVGFREAIYIYIYIFLVCDIPVGHHAGGPQVWNSRKETILELTRWLTSYRCDVILIHLQVFVCMF